MRVACYLRVSTEDQKTDLQQDALIKYCDFKGWQLPSLFIDHGESGAKVNRPQLDAMMSDVRNNRFDIVLTWKFDRIGRSTTHLISILDELQRLNVGFVSVTENIDTTTPMGKMIFTIFAALAEFERATLIMRTKAGMKAARDRGVKIGKPPEIPAHIKAEIKLHHINGLVTDQITALYPHVSRASIWRITRGLQ